MSKVQDRRDGYLTEVELNKGRVNLKEEGLIIRLE
jgi:hypothetical protein